MLIYVFRELYVLVPKSKYMALVLLARCFLYLSLYNLVPFLLYLEMHAIIVCITLMVQSIILLVCKLTTFFLYPTIIIGLGPEIQVYLDYGQLLKNQCESEKSNTTASTETNVIHVTVPISSS